MWQAQNNFFPYFYNNPCFYWPHNAYPHPNSLINPFFIEKEVETKESLLIASKVGLQPEAVCNQKDQKLDVMEKRRQLKKQRIQRKQEREDNFEKKKQKKDRNLPSNIFKNFISFLYSHPQLQLQLNRCVPHQNKVLLSPFISRLKQIIREGQSYIRPSIIQKLWSQMELNKEQSIAFKMLLQRFLKLNLPIIICTMTKLKKKQKTDYLKLGRKLLLQLKFKSLL